MRKAAASTYRQRITPLRRDWVSDDPAPEAAVGQFGSFQSLGDFFHESVQPTFCPHLVLQGAGEMNSSTLKTVVAANQLYVFFPGVHMRYFDYPGKPWRYVWFPMHGTRIEALFTRIGITPQTPRAILPPDSTLVDTAMRWERKLFAGPHTPASAILAAWEIFDSLWKDLHVSERQERRPLAQSCRAQLEARFMNPLTIDQLAWELDVDRTTLFRQFRQAYGESPKAFLDRLRLTRARELLRESEVPVKSIAFSCGYTDPHYFARAFRKRFGLAPSAWRERQG